ncbi:SCO2584 family spore wall biosynthesis protein [Peterkaempfera bronchialis]|uniref:Uncharacterized protein n=1 Tax=Peterkaempfera bronchialis TaxID=2126346 RepID=A0A345SUY3_9ACTN|nr:hypothetical protein [Peterkaempfera bronchialis]AXI77538.1 hypothetical protein C7M71_008875 [Peterkaempfera bronchialis]
MPDDVGGSPYPDGADHGGADDAFAAVVFDEAFIRAATVHEPSAHERMLAAVEARLELEATGAGRAYGGVDDPRDPADDGLPEELRPYRDDEDEADWLAASLRRGRRGRLAGRRGFPVGRHTAAHARWHRPVAWFLAVIMGVGVVAVAVAAVYRGAGGTGTPGPSRSDSGSVGTPAVDQSRQPVVTAPSAAAP